MIDVGGALAERIVQPAWRGAVAVALLLLSAVLTIVLTWIVRGGVEGGLAAAGRFLRHGRTTVHDFAKYPARELQPSSESAPFARATDPAAPPASLPAPDGGAAPLAGILRRTRTLAFIVIRADNIVFEFVAPHHGPEKPSQYFSVTKSILATLVGMAVDDGLIASIDLPVSDFVPELAARGFARTSLRQLLDMTSALDYAENDNPFGLHPLMNYTSQLERMILDFRLRAADGSGFRYKSGDTALLSLALRRALRSVTLTDYAQRRLWSPLGMEDRGLWTLDRDDGFEKAWCCIAGSARDLAKLGRLYLARGKAGGRQLLAERWIEQSAPRVRPGEPRRYALGWWPASADGTDFLAAGKDGQFLYVAPERDTIIVRLGEAHGYDARSGWISLFAALAAHEWHTR